MEEILIQVVFELLFEFVARQFGGDGKEPPGPWLAGFCYLMFGCAAGGISLWLFPGLFSTSPTARWLNVALTPIAVGLAMAWLGAWRQRRGMRRLRTDHFAFAYVFALGMAIVRLVLGK